MMLTSGVLLNHSPKSLYKYLLRECEKLPKAANEFYKHSIRQSYKQHTSESNPERIEQIMERAVLDAKWVVEKYKKELQQKSIKKNSFKY